MSYTEFKKRIDTARQILVGAVPSPAGQIDQITYALIYKFMNDIDDQAASLPGGKRTYFVDEYEKYNWHYLMQQSLSAHDRLELYRQAIQNMAKNERLPELFRSIYQNAFLPFNSANVLTLFLKEVDKFSYEDSDDIGDAYEYLLSITGAQGDVGQFRTPRHIINFMVDVVAPTKDDKVLDPACGTAGFLISAFKYVQRHHDNKNEHDRLSADETSKLHDNYYGFDIDPTMVRTAKVNMYLHDFKTPHIINHDSLSSEDYWSERYDVVLANPPFMTPKGGIQPHRKFKTPAKKSEVLFVDYIISHLKPQGRAAIVIPEGVLENGANNFATLRKIMLESGLYCVVSLPVGVFSPYSQTTKTSILFFDKSRSNQTEILYINAQNDGFSLGRTRAKIDQDDLPASFDLIKRFQNNQPLESNSIEFKLANRDTLLSGLNPQTRLDIKKVFSLVSHKTNDDKCPLNELFIVEKGKLQSSKNIPGEFTFVTASEQHKTHNAYTYDRDDAIIFAANASGSLGRVHQVRGKFIVSDLCYVIYPREGKDINPDYYYHYLRLNRSAIVAQLAKGANKKAINMGDFGKLLIPNIGKTGQDKAVAAIRDLTQTKEAYQQEILALTDKVQKILEEERKIISQ